MQLRGLHEITFPIRAISKVFLGSTHESSGSLSPESFSGRQLPWCLHLCPQPQHRLDPHKDRWEDPVTFLLQPKSWRGRLTKEESNLISWWHLAVQDTWDRDWSLNGILGELRSYLPPCGLRPSLAWRGDQGPWLSAEEEEEPKSGGPGLLELHTWAWHCDTGGPHTPF